jgi:hypothetical protein
MSPRHPVVVVLTGKFVAPQLWSLRAGHRRRSPLGFPVRRSPSSTTEASRLRCHVLGLPSPHSLCSHVGHRHRRFGLPRPRLHRLDVVGENLPLAPHRHLTVHVPESCRLAEGCRRPRSSAGATHAGVTRGRMPRVRAPSALAVVWAAAQPGHAGYCEIKPPWAA